MSMWQVTIRTDEGHKRWASVEAADVAGAIAASGAEADSVRSVKIEDTKRLPVPAIIAIVGLMAYVNIIMFKDWWTEFSVSDIWIAIPIFAIFALTMFLMRKRLKQPNASQSPAKWVGNPVNELGMFRWMLLLGIWIAPIMAVFFGYEVITNMGGEEAISPNDVLMPIFWFAATLLVVLND